jgi:mannose-6-phosphate isomerase-like protein (cupin superfamily)
VTFGTTEGKSWVEAVPTGHGPTFTGRTFSRFHIVGDGGAVPNVCEIWAAGDHAVESHAHDRDELLYVLSGAVEIDGRRVEANGVVFIPRGTAYGARVLSVEGSHVLRVEIPNGGRGVEAPEYEARAWTGPLTGEGIPNLP